MRDAVRRAIGSNIQQPVRMAAGILAQNPVCRRSINLAALLPDAAKFHNSGHVRDRNRIRIAHHHVQEACSKQSPAKIRKSRSGARFGNHQPLRKRDPSVGVAGLLCLLDNGLHPRSEAPRQRQCSHIPEFRGSTFQLHVIVHDEVGRDQIERVARVGKLLGIPVLEEVFVPSGCDQSRSRIDCLDSPASRQCHSRYTLLRRVPNLEIAPKFIAHLP